jgi:pimeloyl-ACP methyl ester carboxylesterase
MKGASLLVRWGLGSIIVWLIFCGAIGIFALEGALHPVRLSLAQLDKAQAQSIAARNHAKLTDVAIPGEDGAILRGWSMQPLASNGDTVILLHGQAGNRAGMLNNADIMLRHGYAVLLPDSRAHGETGGQIATYGVEEVEDVRRWFEWIERSEAPHCIEGLGDSMGGAILLQSLIAEPGFCAVVAESAFATFDEAAFDRLGQKFGTGPWLGRTVLRPALEAGLLYAHWRYRIDLSQDSPERAVASSRIPVFLIHGLADSNLPPRHAEMIKAGNGAVALWEPAGAGHCEAATVAPEEYERRVVAWFQSHDASDGGVTRH